MTAVCTVPSESGSRCVLVPTNWLTVSSDPLCVCLHPVTLCLYPVNLVSLYTVTDVFLYPLNDVNLSWLRADSAAALGVALRLILAFYVKKVSKLRSGTVAAALLALHTLLWTTAN